MMTARIRKHAAKAAWALAAAAWGAVITADMLNLDDHIWACLLVLAGILTGTAALPALLGTQVAERIDRHYTAVATAAARRPADPAMTPDPWPALRAVRAAQNGNGHKPRGKHAISG